MFTGSDTDIISQAIPEEVESNDDQQITDEADGDILKGCEGNNLDKLMFSIPELRIMESLLQVIVVINLIG